MSAAEAIPPAPTPRDQLLACVPRLRAFAMSLCGQPDQADDLVQETLVKAWAHLGSFEPGTNMAGWLYTILRNEFYSRFRKRRHEVDDPDGALAARLATQPAQDSHMQFLDFRAALFRLASEQREALMLVGANGLSYEEAAGICKCAVGTMKSRVNRARNRLAELLAMNPNERFAGDRSWSGGTDGQVSRVTAGPLV